MIEILIIITVIIVLIVFFFSKSPLNDQTTTTYSAEYYRGLNYLLNNEDDKALRIFTDLIDVDSSTIETHLALGGVYRRRGEFDKALSNSPLLLYTPPNARCVSIVELSTSMRSVNILSALSSSLLSK